MRVMCLAHEHNTCPWEQLKPILLDLESSVPTMKPLCLPPSAEYTYVQCNNKLKDQRFFSFQLKTIPLTELAVRNLIFVFLVPFPFHLPIVVAPKSENTA